MFHSFRRKGAFQRELSGKSAPELGAAIPTGLTLADQDVDDLVAAGEESVRNSPEIKALRSEAASP